MSGRSRLVLLGFASSSILKQWSRLTRWPIFFSGRASKRRTAGTSVAAAVDFARWPIFLAFPVRSPAFT